MQTRIRKDVGMTLVELMIVVVIIGILAAIAVVGFRKYIAKARLSEASAILAEIAAKEQLYLLDAGQYCPARADSAAYPSADEAAGAFWPHDPTVKWDSAREAFAVNPVPAQWRRLGIRPRWPQLFCTYMANAGAGCTAVAPSTCPAPGAVGTYVFPTATLPNVPWFYAIAACNLRGEAGWDGTLGHETTMVLTNDSAAMVTIDETN